MEKNKQMFISTIKNNDSYQVNPLIFGTSISFTQSTASFQLVIRFVTESCQKLPSRHNFLFSEVYRTRSISFLFFFRTLFSLLPSSLSLQNYFLIDITFCFSLIIVTVAFSEN